MPSKQYPEKDLTHHLELAVPWCILQSQYGPSIATKENIKRGQVVFHEQRPAFEVDLHSRESNPVLLSITESAVRSSFLQEIQPRSTLSLLESVYLTEETLSAELIPTFLAAINLSNSQNLELQRFYYWPELEHQQKYPEIGTTTTTPIATTTITKTIQASQFLTEWIVLAASAIEKNLNLRHHVQRKFEANNLARFVLIIFANAFRYTNGVKSQIQEKKKPDIENAPPFCKSTNLIRLYLWASKIAHSCEPNLLLLATATGSLQGIARRDIQANELLCSSYLSEDLSYGSLIFSTVVSRRRHLNCLMLFSCSCSRCQSDDATITQRSGNMFVKQTEIELDTLCRQFENFFDSSNRISPKSFLCVRDMEPAIKFTPDMLDGYGHLDPHRLFLLFCLAKAHVFIDNRSPFKPFMILNFEKGLEEYLTFIQLVQRQTQDSSQSVNVLLGSYSILMNIRDSLRIKELKLGDSIIILVRRIISCTRVFLRDADPFRQHIAAVLSDVESLVVEVELICSSESTNSSCDPDS